MTSRLAVPASVDTSPAAAQPQLRAVEKSLGSVPNLFRLLGSSPASLDGYLSLSGALGKGSLEPATRERLALTVAEANACDYCLSAHSFLGKNVAKLSDTEMDANRQGSSDNAKAAAALRFASQVVKSRGRVADADVQAVRTAGYDDAQIVEIVLHVALNTLTNYLNGVAQTDIDFPVVKHHQR